MKRSVGIDICKGIAILTVIWHHSFIKYPVNLLDETWCKTAWLIDHTYFMQVFFVVSGYLLALSNNRSYQSILFQKTKRLLIPYLGYEIINLVLKLIFPSFVNRKVITLSTYAFQMIFQGGELWFLYVLFMLFAIWTFVLKNANIFAQLAIAGILITICCALPIDRINNLLLLGEIFRYSPFFIIGYCLKSVKLEKLLNKHIVVISTIIYFVLCMLYINKYAQNRICWFAVSFAGCWFVCSISYVVKRLRFVNKSLSYLGKYSMQLYWLNGFALVLSRTISIKICPHGNIILLVVCIFIMTLLLEVLGVHLIKKVPIFSKHIGLL